MENKPYILNEYDTKKLGDISLNRCTPLRDAFQPSGYKLGKPTPNKENDCSGPHFIRAQEAILNVSFGALGPLVTEPVAL